MPTITTAQRDEARAVSRDWTAEAAFIHWEGEALQCAHSGRDIPSAYGEVEE